MAVVTKKSFYSNFISILDPIWIREEMEEVGRVVVLQVPTKYPDIRDLLTNRAIRKNAFVLFFVW